MHAYGLEGMHEHMTCPELDGSILNKPQPEYSAMGTVLYCTALHDYTVSVYAFVFDIKYLFFVALCL